MSKTKEWYTEVVKNRIEAKGECVVARNNGGVLVGWSYFFQKNDISDDIIGILKKNVTQIRLHISLPLLLIRTHGQRELAGC